jgi:hypothetical protein
MVDHLKKIKLRLDKSYRRYLWEWGIRTGQAQEAAQQYFDEERKKAGTKPKKSKPTP